jgi:RNA polymerase sigma-32 factor
MENMHSERLPETEESLSFDPLRSYLKEISKHPLLTREEEHELAVRALAGNDKAAKEKMVVSNLRLVVRIALSYYNTHLNLLDLIQEGNVGLLHAVDKYNPGKGAKLSTYASFWIRAYILKYIMGAWSIVKVGTTESQRKLFFSLNREKKRLAGMGMTGVSQLLADTLHVEVADVEDMEKRLHYTDVSLDGPMFEDGDDNLLDMLDDGENVEELLVEREKKEIVSKGIKEFKKRLNEKQLYILENRILAEERLTLQDIGTRFNTSRENVRQIEMRVSRDLKRNLVPAPSENNLYQERRSA